LKGPRVSEDAQAIFQCYLFYYEDRTRAHTKNKIVDMCNGILYVLCFSNDRIPEGKIVYAQF